MEKKLHGFATRRSLTMKKLFIVGLVLLSAGPLLAQTKIGGSGAPDNSAMLEVTGGPGNNKGILPPRLTTPQRDAITSPATGLMIYNTTANQLQVNIGTPAAPVWTVPTASNAWFLTGNAGINPATQFLGTTDAQPLIFRTNNTEQIRITSNGQVGIGTASPATKLHVDNGTLRVTVKTSPAYPGIMLLSDGGGGGYSDDIAIKSYGIPGSAIDQYSARGTAAAPLSLTNGADIGYLNFYGHTSAGEFGARSFLRARYLGDGTNNKTSLTLGTSGADRIFINDSGLVGIGTGTPVARLDVAGTARISGSAGTATAVVGRNAAGDISNLTLGAGLSIAGGTLNTTAVAGWALAGNAGTNPATQFVGTTDAQPLIFRTGNTEKVRIATNGNVGIGTAVANSPLSFPSTLSPKITLWDGGSTTDHFGFGISAASLNYHIADVPSAHRFFVGGVNGNGTELMRIQGNGQVGIATAAPHSLLDLGVGAGTTTSAAAGKKLAVYNASDGTDFYGFGVSTDVLQFHAASTPAEEPGMILNSAGNVGIGTVTPAQKLDVAGTARISGSAGTATAVVGRNAAGDISNITLGSNLSLTGGVLNATVPTSGWSLTGNAGTNPATNFIGTTDAQPLIFRTNNSEYLRIASTGNVGIFDATPLAPLSFASAEGPKIRFYDDGTDNLTYGIGITSASLNYHIESNAVAAHRFFAGGSNGDGTELMKIQGNGNVGIGIATPTAKLDVNGTARIAGSAGTPTAITGRDASGYISNITLGANLSLAGGVLSASGGGTAGWSLTGNAGTNPATNFIGTTDAQPLWFRTSNANQMVLTPSGFLGMNTANPSARLTISNNSADPTSDDVVLQRFSNGGVPVLTFINSGGTEAAPTPIPSSQDAVANIHFRARVTGGYALVGGIRQLYKGDGTNNLGEMQFRTSGQMGISISENQNVAIGTSVLATQRLEVNGNVLANSYLTASDRRLKTNIVDMQQGIEELMKLRPVTYSMKADTVTATRFGFIAQELEKIMPEVVNKPKTDKQFYSVNYAELVPVLTKAIQEQQAQIEALKAENQKLKVSSTVTAELMERVKKMEQMLAIKANERSSTVAAK